MKLLFLTNSDVTRPLYEWLVSRGENVIYHEDKVTPGMILDFQIEFIVSYNYSHIIKPDVISLLPHHIINLHISYLPWNRGASPNLWAFLEGTPCGITIHKVDQGLDTGDILVQKKLVFDHCKETLRNAYEKSHAEIQKLFQMHWNEMKCGKIPPFKQSGQGSFHVRKDLASYKQLFTYDDYIDDFVRKVTSDETWHVLHPC